MKYFLAIDKGEFRGSNDRFKVLDLTSINPELSKDNNLKSLTKFTCSFNTKYELKQFLLSKSLLDSKNSMYDIVIYYERAGIKTKEVAFQCDEVFFDISRLSSIILDKSKSETFLRVLLNAYEKNPYMSEEVGLIREYYNDIFIDYKFYDAIRAFINKLCYSKNKAGKYVLRFSAVYDLGLFVSKLSNGGRTRLINSVPKKENELTVKENIDETIAFEIENLVERKRNIEEDEQINLFRM